MCSEYLLLFFQNIRYFLLESEKLFIFLVSHCSFHRIKIIFYFFFILNFCFLLNLNLLVYDILLSWIILFIIFIIWIHLRRVIRGNIILGTWPNDWLFNRIRSIFLVFLLFFNTIMICTIWWPNSLTWHIIISCRFWYIFYAWRRKIFLLLYIAFIRSWVNIFWWLLFSNHFLRINFLYIFFWKLFLFFFF